jgi:hypothetical protein
MVEPAASPWRRHDVAATLTWDLVGRLADGVISSAWKRGLGRS